MKVFVTDADQKHALAAVRALGRENVEVHAGATTRYAVSFYSRYCHRKVVYPNPIADEKKFVGFLQKYTEQEKIDVLLPVGYDANVIASKYREVLSKYVHLAVADYDRMLIASDKSKTMTFADSLGIKIPITYRSMDEVRSFPVVVKGTKGTGAVKYINSREQLLGLDLSSSIIQEYIPGEGYGFYGLFCKGQPKAIFMHKRRREFPITGGASTAAESYYDDRLKDQSIRLLSALMWHGVAMVEMKKDERDGNYKLMEINPKFWGSLDLSIAAGVNFPYLAAIMALHGNVDPVLEYDRQVKFSWPFPQEILHLLARPRSSGQILRDFFDPRVKTNVLWQDCRPNLYLIGMTPFVIFNRVIKGRLYFPQGKPKLHDSYRLSCS